MLARVVDENPAHDPRGDRENLRAVLQSDASLIHEPQIRLVDEPRGAQRVTVAFATKLPLGDRGELVVNERDELVPRRRIAAAILDVLRPHRSRSPHPKMRHATSNCNAMRTERLVPITLRTPK